QDQVVRVNIWAQKEPGETIIRGARNISGTVETASERGRLTDPTIFNDFETFCGGQAALPSGMTLFPVIRETTIVGPPPSYEYRDVLWARANPKLLKLSSRRVGLCAS
ncbi:unnamed protein product, partial [marine sediment metagenome]